MPLVRRSRWFVVVVGTQSVYFKVPCILFAYHRCVGRNGIIYDRIMFLLCTVDFVENNVRAEHTKHHKWWPNDMIYYYTLRLIS